MAEIQLQAPMTTDDSDVESPVPKRMRCSFEQEERSRQATVEAINGWSSGDGKTICSVPACNGETFSRFSSFRKHWMLKHRRLIDVFPCTDCGYQSADVWDVKRHIAAKHNKNEEVWLQSQKMKNNKFIDPGILTSPAKINKPANRREIPRRAQGGEPEEAAPQEEPTISPVNQTQPINPVTQETPPSHNSQLLVRAAEAKRLKDKYAQEEAELRTQYQAFEARKWYKLYCQERDQRRKAEEHIKYLEDKLKTLENPKLLAIAKILES